MKHPQAVDWLVQRGVSRRTANRLGVTAYEWRVVERVGQGHSREYEHWLLEAFAVYWHPLFLGAGSGLFTSMRRRVFWHVMGMDCEPRVLVVRRGVIDDIDEEEISLSLFEGGVLLLPVHYGCQGLESEGETVGLASAG